MRAGWIVLGGLALLLGGCSAAADADDAVGSVAVDATTDAVEITEQVQVDGAPLCSFGDDECPRDNDPAVGLAAPTFESVDPSGRPVALGDGPVLVVFVAHWCEFCQADLPALVGAGDAMPIVVVSTGQDPDGANWPPSAWFAREGWDGPVAVDDVDVSLAHAYGVSALPYWVAIDADGNVRERASGSKSLAEIVALAG